MSPEDFPYVITHTRHGLLRQTAAMVILPATPFQEESGSILATSEHRETITIAIDTELDITRGHQETNKYTHIQRHGFEYCRYCNSRPWGSRLGDCLIDLDMVLDDGRGERQQLQARRDHEFRARAM